MNISNLLDSVLKKGVYLTYNETNLQIVSTNSLDERDRELVKKSKTEIIHYLKGYHLLKKGGPATTPIGNLMIWEVYPGSHRIGLKDFTGTVYFFGLNEIAILGQYTFLKERFQLIEFIIRRHKQERWCELFAFYRLEWHYLLKELNRQHFLLETWQESCSRLIKIDEYNRCSSTT